MSLSVRPIRRDEVYAFRAAVMRVFGADADPGDEDERFAKLLDLDRIFAAFDGDDIVGTAAAFTLELTVPGGLVPMAGLTAVTVLPSHRRRGILRALMAEHFADVRRRGEPLSGLWASETGIYGRFGYGPATETEAFAVDLRGVELEPGTGGDSVRIIDGDVLAELLPRVHDELRRGRPGVLGRSADWWRLRRLRETPEARPAGSSRLRAAVSWRGDRPSGYALYRQRPAFEDNLAAGKLDVVELLTADGEAEASLWRLLCSVDLFPHLTWWNAPSDCLLPWLLRDRRKVQRRRLDNLWLRPCDVVAALRGRRYALDGELCIHVVDSQDEANAGAYLLRVEKGQPTCERTQRPAQLRTDAAGLGAVYMGAHRPSMLARVGRLAVDDGATLALADALFSWPTAAWCPEVF